MSRIHNVTLWGKEFCIKLEIYLNMGAAGRPHNCVVNCRRLLKMPLKNLIARLDSFDKTVLSWGNWLIIKSKSAAMLIRLNWLQNAQTLLGIHLFSDDSQTGKLISHRIYEGIRQINTANFADELFLYGGGLCGATLY